jgi:hypothetical protein
MSDRTSGAKMTVKYPKTYLEYLECHAAGFVFADSTMDPQNVSNEDFNPVAFATREAAIEWLTSTWQPEWRTDEVVEVTMEVPTDEITSGIRAGSYRSKTEIPVLVGRYRLAEEL